MNKWCIQAVEYHTAMTKHKATRHHIESHPHGNRRKGTADCHTSQNSGSSNVKRREGLGLGDMGRGGFRVHSGNGVLALYSKLGCMYFSLNVQYFSNFKKKCKPSPSVPRI